MLSFPHVQFYWINEQFQFMSNKAELKKRSKEPTFFRDTPSRNCRIGEGEVQPSLFALLSAFPDEQTTETGQADLTLEHISSHLFDFMQKASDFAE